MTTTIRVSGIRHLLLDIEGTTCPVSFVAGTLFPYAAQHLEPYLREYSQQPELRPLLIEVQEAWRSDPEPKAMELWEGLESLPWDAPQRLAVYLRWLISTDRKLSALKELQGRIWRQGYACGALVAPLFDDVPAALRRWHSAGIVLSVYSSGSVEAQKLLYRHSNAGDLMPLFRHWFDTRIGAKREATSYAAIAAELQSDPAGVLFISDAPAECHAAANAGMAVLFSDRAGNPERACGPFTAISHYDVLVLQP